MPGTLTFPQSDIVETIEHHDAGETTYWLYERRIVCHYMHLQTYSPVIAENIVSIIEDTVTTWPSDKPYLVLHYIEGFNVLTVPKEVREGLQHLDSIFPPEQRGRAAVVFSIARTTSVMTMLVANTIMRDRDLNRRFPVRTFRSVNEAYAWLKLGLDPMGG